MRIGIITFQRAHNFGAQMQMYALYNFLKDNNHEVKVLDYRNKLLDSSYYIRLSPIKEYLKRSFLKGLIDFSKDLIKLLIFHNKKVGKFERFANQNVLFTKAFTRGDDLPESFDILITGSDQVWNYNLVSYDKEIYFLDVKGNTSNTCKLISYAASSEKNAFHLLENDKLYITSQLNKFHNITVREKGLSDFLKHQFNISSCVVLDPTFLLSKMDYLKIAQKPSVKNYICVYEVSKSNHLMELAKRLSILMGLKIVYTHSSGFAQDNAGTYGPKEQLGLIFNADIVITSSFHGTALSIIGRKDFYCVYDKPNLRITDLLELFGLQSRIIYDIKDFVSFTKITYNEELIDNCINESKNILLTSCR